MAINPINGSAMTNPYSPMRVSGLGSSGIDVNSIVSQLMQVERIPYDKLDQKKQLTQWTIDAYRDVTSQLQTFKSTFFDILSPTNYMLSPNTYKKFTGTSGDSTTVTVTANAGAVIGNHSITVNGIATAAVNQSSSTVTKPLEGTSAVTFTSGQTFNLSVDGTQKTITVGSSVTDLQNAINAAFGSNKVNVSIDSSSGTNKLLFTTMAGVNKLTLSSGSTNDALTSLGFGSGTNLSNRLSTTDSLATIATKMNNSFSFDPSNNINLTINGKSFTFSNTTSLSSMMNQINSDSTANVNMQYDELSDTFKFTAKQLGAGTTVQLSETGSTFLAAANFKSVNGTSSMTALTNMNYLATNKSFVVNIDGVSQTITLNKDYSADIDYSRLASDIQTQIQNAFSSKGAVVSVTTTGGKLGISLVSGGSTLSIGDVSSGTSALSDLGLTANYTSGSDASVLLDGQTLTRSSNNFTVNGVTYNLLKKNTTPVTVSLTQDVDTVYNNIKSFVDKYNGIIDYINGKLEEHYDRDYQPLTSDQRSQMSDTSISNWEKKAKTGLLENDSILKNIVYSMRRALSDSVSGISSSLSSIGITTGSWMDEGKLQIDETKLRNAIQTNPDAVMNLFSKQSSITSNYNLSSTQRTQRYNEEGLMYRISDILDDNIGTFGTKGALLQKAGIVGDSSQYSNSLYKQLSEYNTEMIDMNEQLMQKQNNYYRMYSNLETVLDQMNQQKSWLSSQLGQSANG